jgi:EF-P beta-lysylation protein EpmB
MIPATAPPRHLSPRSWQKALQACISEPHALAVALGLDDAWLADARRAAQRFTLRVPASYLARIRRGDPDDPLLRQVLPLGAELDEVPGYVTDPVGDLLSLAGAGVLHKYHGRALLVTTGACAIHCRYCFRREFPYAEQHAGAQHFADALALIRQDQSITEVLLSGGDPLTLGDRRLGQLLDELERIPHLQRVRLHTRLPVVLPERIDAGFIAMWGAVRRLQRIVVIHANHAQELAGAADVHAALAALHNCGTTLLNQSVLLRGVNDSTAALEALSLALFDAGVLPYYLHLLDPVRGAAHFDVPEAEAQALHAALTARLPGYLVPRLVREVAGAPAKTMLPPASR